MKITRDASDKPPGQLVFNPPPNWPTPPPGWLPPAGWRPPPEWGPAPDNWRFYLVADRAGAIAQHERTVSGGDVPNQGGNAPTGTTAASRQLPKRAVDVGRRFVKSPLTQQAARKVKDLARDERTKTALRGAGIVVAGALATEALRRRGLVLPTGLMESLTASPEARSERVTSPGPSTEVDDDLGEMGDYVSIKVQEFTLDASGNGQLFFHPMRRELHAEVVMTGLFTDYRLGVIDDVFGAMNWGIGDLPRGEFHIVRMGRQLLPLGIRGVGRTGVEVAWYGPMWAVQTEPTLKPDGKPEGDRTGGPAEERSSPNQQRVNAGKRLGADLRNHMDQEAQESGMLTGPRGDRPAMSDAEFAQKLRAGREHGDSIRIRL